MDLCLSVHTHTQSLEAVPDNAGTISSKLLLVLLGWMGRYCSIDTEQFLESHAAQLHERTVDALSFLFLSMRSLISDASTLRGL